MKIVFIAFVSLIFVILSFSYLYSGNFIYLSTDTEIPIYASLEDSMNNGKIIGSLKKNEELIVLKCHDVKHYLVPEVELNDGTSGFINDNYNLRKERATYIISRKKVFQC